MTCGTVAIVVAVVAIVAAAVALLAAGFAGRWHCWPLALLAAGIAAATCAHDDSVIWAPF